MQYNISIPTFTLEQYTAIYNNSPELKELYGSAEEAYNAYLAAQGQTQTGGHSVVGGVGHTAGGTPGGTSGNTQTLPSYMSFDDSGNVVFAEGTTNRQFVDGLNMLGLLGGDHPEGTDYDWLIKWFTNDNEGGQSNWLNVHLRDPNRQLDYSSIGSGLTSENQATLRRLYDIVNNASTTGGYFTPTQQFQATYGYAPSVGTPGGSDGGSDGGAIAPIRPIFSGVAPTVGSGGAYYSPSDILVTSDEQPNLYGYGIFNPYSAQANAGLPNPYDTQVNLDYAYQPSDGTPPITTVTNPTDPIDPVVDDPTDPVDPVDPINPDPCPAGSSMGPDGYCIPDPCPPGQVRNADGVCVIDNTGTTTCPDGYVKDENGNCVPITQPPPPPTYGDGDYVSFADAQGIDDYLHSQRDVGYRGDVQALLGSRQDLSAEEFGSLLAQQSGAFGEGSTLAYDPRFGIYSTMSEDQLSQYQAGEGGFNYGEIDPRYMTDEDRIRNNMLGGGTGALRYRDDQGRFFYINKDRMRLRIGDKQYIMNEDGTVTSYTVRDTPRSSGPSFNKQRPDAGFAEGGIVTIAGDIADMQTTGEGIESFLNPERSKATLRRNLAKLASPPMAPAPTMQQGIMPMAR